MTSTNAQVIFISETRNTSISSTHLKNHFGVDKAYIVPAQGLSGGLKKKFALICLYGDPHHRETVSI